MDDVSTLATEMRISLSSMVNAFSGPVMADSSYSESAVGFLRNMADALQHVDHFAQNASYSDKLAFAKFRALLEIYQSSMRYWELNLREAMLQNLSGNVDPIWSKKIGEGRFAVVCQGSAVMKGKAVKVAVKRQRKKRIGDDDRFGMLHEV